MSNPQATTSDELEIAEAQNSLSDLLYDYAAQSVTTRIGQFVYRRVDGLLSTVEKTARWSLPQPPPSEEDTSKINISAPPLIRPLPWLLFLPALIILRLVREQLSVLALILGKQPVTPATVVAFLQNKRRKLRALKYRGQKLARINRAEQLVEDELKTTWLSRITLPLRTVICTRRVGNRPVKAVIYHHPTHHKHHKHGAKKRNVDERDDGDSEDSFEDVGCQELLERYANHAGDSSYAAEEEASEDSSDSFISENEKSNVEDEVQKDDKPPTARKESNGHANLEKHKQSEDPKQKSSLNVESGRPVSPAAKKSEEPPITPSADEPSRNGSADAASSKSVNSANRSKSTANIESDQAAAKSVFTSVKSTPNLTPSEGEGNETKAVTPSEPDGKDQSEDSAKSDNLNTSKGQLASMIEVKTNYQQKSKQQQQPLPPQQQQQQPQQAVTANGGGGKKQKRPSQSYH